MCGGQRAYAFVAVVLMIVVTGGATQALGKVAKVGSKVTIASAGQHSFSGKVSSKRKPCRANRKVEIHLIDKRGDTVVGFGRTRRGGGYAITTQGQPKGSFYARATRKQKIVSGRGVVCKPRNSPLIQVG